MKNLVLAGLILLLSATAVGAPLQFNLTLNPNPPEDGANRFELLLSAEASSVPDSTQVQAEFSMPAMGTMPAMLEKVDIRPNGRGSFTGSFNLSMRGTWELTLRVSTASGTTTRKFSITTGIPGVTSRDVDTPTTTQSATAPIILAIGPERLQRIGVRFAEAEMRPLQREIRALGVVETDALHRSDITLRFSGYIEKTFRVRVGDFVKKGTPLFVVYSPELQNARNELLFDHQGSGTGNHVKTLALEKLRNLGIESVDFNDLRSSTSPKGGWSIRAPSDGTILALNAIPGTSFSKGQILCALGDLQHNYIVARIFQNDLPDVSVGQRVRLAVPEDPGAKPIPAHVDRIIPNSVEGAGTSDVRIVTDKPTSTLRPGTYVELTLQAELGTRLVVPATAILYSGQHRYVFVDQGNGNLEPRLVRTGKTTSAWIEILSGIEEHTRVVSHGMFLVSSEAQLRSALPKWSGNEGEP